MPTADEIRLMIAREIWHYQECTEQYGAFDEAPLNDGTMKSLVKRMAIDQAELIRKALVDMNLDPEPVGYLVRKAEKSHIGNDYHFVSLAAYQHVEYRFRDLYTAIFTKIET